MLIKKLEWLGYRTVKKNYDDILSRFHLIPERYGPTDGRTDRFAISISRVSMLARDKNSRVRRIHMSKPTVQQYQQSCHRANGNKTCCSLLLFKNNKLSRGSQGFVCQSSRNVVLRVEQLCLELQYSAAFGCVSRKFAGEVWKYAKFRHFLAHPVV